MSVKISGNISGNTAEVDVNSRMLVNLPTPASGGITASGYVALASEVDSGTLYGSRTLVAPLTSEDRRLLVGLDTPMFNFTFNSAAQDTGSWRYVQSTTTVTWNTGGMLLNANSDVTTGHGVNVTTWRSFPLWGGAGMRVEMGVQITAAPLANQVLEFGLFPIGSVAIPTEGVYFRFTSAGLIGVANYNTVETVTGTLLSAGSFFTATNYLFQIIITENAIQFWQNGVLLTNGILSLPVANGQPFSTSSLPLSFQFRNAGTVTGSPVMQAKITNCHISQRDFNLAKPYPHVQAGVGLMAYQGTNGNTMGTTALLGNSLASGAGAVLTNTTAAAGSGLGGQFSVQPTLAVGNDGILCSYQNPVGSINITPRTLYITGVRIQGAVSTTALTGGPVLYAYSLAFGHTTVSMAQAEGIAAKAPRRIAIGFETYAATAAVGVIGTGCSMAFASPIVVNPGEFVAICAKNLGVVTSAGVIAILVSFDAYEE